MQQDKKSRAQKAKNGQGYPAYSESTEGPPSPRHYYAQNASKSKPRNIRDHDPNSASHTSVYFTPEPEGQCQASAKSRGRRSKNRRKHATKRIHIHIARDTHNPDVNVNVRSSSKKPNYSRKGPSCYDPLTHSEPRSDSSDLNSSDNECGDRRRVAFYNPVKRSCSQESAGGYVTQFRKRLEDDKRIGGEILPEKSPRHCSAARKKVYRPIEAKDTCLQTEDASKINEEIQTSPEVSDLAKCCKGDQCDLLKGCTTEGQKTVGVDCNIEQRNLDDRGHCTVRDTGHVFPFIGQSPSGNLKVCPQMVSFENKNISLLVANPNKTRLRHQEYFDPTSNKGQEDCQDYGPARANRRDHYRNADKNSHPDQENPSGSRKARCHREDNPPERQEAVNDYQPHVKRQHSTLDIHAELGTKNHHGQTRNKAHCHKEDNPPEITYREDVGRNYEEEMRAWMASRPFLKSDDSPVPPQLNLHPTHSKIDMAKEYAQHPDPQDSRRNTLPFPPRKSNPPKVPAFPRDTSPPVSSFPTNSDAYASDTDMESSYHTSNPTKVQIKNSRGTIDFMENLHYRVKRAIHPDTKVIIGNKEFPLHSVALQIHSKYFDNLRRPREALYRVELPESIISPDDFQHVMDWILSDEDDRKLVLTRENVVGLFSSAQHLIIPELKAQCLKFVQEKVDSDDPKLIKLWEESHLRPKTKELVSLLSQKLTTLFPKLYKTRQFLKLDVNELVTLLDSPDVVIDTEMDVFDAAVRWLLYDWPNRKRHTVKVMSTIRFGFLTPLQLTQMRYLSEDNEAPDFKKIFGFESIKKLLEDGLTYAILKQSYANRTTEFNKWIRNTGVQPPKPRIHLDTEADNRQTERPLSTVTTDVKQKGKDENQEMLDKLLAFDLNSLKDDVEDIVETAVEKAEGYSHDIPTREHEAETTDQEFTSKQYHPRQQSARRLSDFRNPEDGTMVNSDAQEDYGEEIEVEHNQNEVQAAVTIQKYFRGYLGRKRFNQVKAAAAQSQEALRGLIRKIIRDSKVLVRSRDGV